MKYDNNEWKLSALMDMDMQSSSVYREYKINFALYLEAPAPIALK